MKAFTCLRVLFDEVSELRMAIHGTAVYASSPLLHANVAFLLNIAQIFCLPTRPDISCIITQALSQFRIRLTVLSRSHPLFFSFLITKQVTSIIPSGNAYICQQRAYLDSVSTQYLTGMGMNPSNI